MTCKGATRLAQRVPTTRRTGGTGRHRNGSASGRSGPSAGASASVDLRSSLSTSTGLLSSLSAGKAFLSAGKAFLSAGKAFQSAGKAFLSAGKEFLSAGKGSGGKELACRARFCFSDICIIDRMTFRLGFAPGIPPFGGAGACGVLWLEVADSTTMGTCGVVEVDMGIVAVCTCVVGELTRVVGGPTRVVGELTLAAPEDPGQLVVSLDARLVSASSLPQARAGGDRSRSGRSGGAGGVSVPDSGSSLASASVKFFMRTACDQQVVSNP